MRTPNAKRPIRVVKTIFNSRDKFTQPGLNAFLIIGGQKDLNTHPSFEQQQDGFTNHTSDDNATVVVCSKKTA